VVCPLRIAKVALLGKCIWLPCLNTNLACHYFLNDIDRLAMHISTSIHSGTHVLSLIKQLFDLYLLCFPLHRHLHQNFHHLALFPQAWVLRDERSNLIFPVLWCDQTLFANKNLIQHGRQDVNDSDAYTNLHRMCEWPRRVKATKVKARLLPKENFREPFGLPKLKGGNPSPIFRMWHVNSM